MANPQPTPFVRFSKELYEAFYMNPPATIAACRLWLWVLRWTWADFGKLETKERSLTQIAAEVGMSKPQVCKELASLIRCRRLKLGKEGGYAIQKDYDLWRDDTKKRATHYGNTMKQASLFTPVDNLGITLPPVSHGETEPVHRVKRNRFTVRSSAVSPYEPPIRSENTGENKGEGAQGRAPKISPQLPNNKKDTPRNRAELGHEDFVPEDHHDFKVLTFKRKDELMDTWKAAAEAARKAAACRKGCGRPRATAAWPYCRPCTVCHVCEGGPDGTRKFQTGPAGVTCTACVDQIK